MKKKFFNLILIVCLIFSATTLSFAGNDISEDEITLAPSTTRISASGEVTFEIQRGIDSASGGSGYKYFIPASSSISISNIDVKVQYRATTGGAWVDAPGYEDTSKITVKAHKVGGGTITIMDGFVIDTLPSGILKGGFTSGSKYSIEILFPNNPYPYATGEGLRLVGSFTIGNATFSN